MNDDLLSISNAGEGPNSQQAGRTQWHRLLGAMLEMLLTPVGITVQTEVQVISDPPKADVLLLRRDGVRWTLNQLRLLCDGLRDSLASHHLLEFKYTESINGLCLQQGIGYDYFYRQSQQLDAKAIQTTVISARTPRAAVLRQYGYVETQTPGVYRSEYPLLDRVQIIVLNQLRPVEQNAFVQCFASRRSVRSNAFIRLQSMDWHNLGETLWEFVIGLQGQIGVQGGNMSEVIMPEGLTPEKVIALGKKIRKALVATLTPEERLAGLAPEDRVAGLAPEERVAGLAPEERVAGLAPEERLAGLAPKERLAGLTPQEVPELLEQIDAYLHQQGKSSDFHRESPDHLKEHRNEDFPQHR
jgi:hypothetical protein